MPHLTVKKLLCWNNFFASCFTSPTSIYLHPTLSNHTPDVYFFYLAEDRQNYPVMGYHSSYGIALHLVLMWSLLWCSRHNNLIETCLWGSQWTMHAKSGPFTTVCKRASMIQLWGTELVKSRKTQTVLWPAPPIPHHFVLSYPNVDEVIALLFRRNSTNRLWTLLP